jgi:hypothetical protein
LLSEVLSGGGGGGGGGEGIVICYHRMISYYVKFYLVEKSSQMYLKVETLYSTVSRHVSGM